MSPPAGYNDVLDLLTKVPPGGVEFVPNISSTGHWAGPLTDAELGAQLDEIGSKRPVGPQVEVTRLAR